MVGLSFLVTENKTCGTTKETLLPLSGVDPGIVKGKRSLSPCEAMCPPRGVWGHASLERFGLYIFYLGAKLMLCTGAWIAHVRVCDTLLHHVY